MSYTELNECLGPIDPRYFRSTASAPPARAEFLATRQRGPRTGRFVESVCRRCALQLRLLRQGRRLGTTREASPLEARLSPGTAILLGLDEQAHSGAACTPTGRTGHAAVLRRESPSRRPVRGRESRFRRRASFSLPSVPRARRQSH